MDEWENPNPITLSERAAQRSAAQSRAPSSSHRAKSQCAGGTLAALYSMYLVPFCGRGSARRDSLRPAALAQESRSSPNKRFLGRFAHHQQMESPQHAHHQGNRSSCRYGMPLRRTTKMTSCGGDG